uniref:Thioredoxin n=1 Tax=Iridovirus LCIVAC01 TaxID=2506607 RepID=A0A481YQ07_9VIRU|nr:MAG: thioredoxin [Iridovirus LCIVAC01]
MKSKKPVVVILQGAFCGYCKTMHPNFQSFADKMKNKVTCATVQIDGNESEKRLGKRLDKIMGKFLGVPTVIAFKGGSFYREYKGDRSEQSLIEFGNNL